jgi:hypothetical protein
MKDCNTFNIQGKVAIQLFNSNYIEQFKEIQKKYIVLNQFWSIHLFSNIVENIYPNIIPCKKLTEIYEKIKTELFPGNEPYNAIHYRHEHDFKNHFHLQIQSLESILVETKKKFKQPDLKIYIATSDYEKIVSGIIDPEIRNSIVSKNINNYPKLNFEEWAFVDYMIVLHSCDFFGHHNSSFSAILNQMKGSPQNYYA